MSEQLNKEFNDIASTSKKNFEAFTALTEKLKYKENNEKNNTSTSFPLRKNKFERKNQSVINIHNNININVKVDDETIYKENNLKEDLKNIVETVIKSDIKNNQIILPSIDLSKNNDEKKIKNKVSKSKKSHLEKNTELIKTIVTNRKLKKLLNENKNEKSESSESSSASN